MASPPGSGTLSSNSARARCRCGHFPTHHMVVMRTDTTANYRLDPSGPCAICGERVCAKFSPGGP